MATEDTPERWLACANTSDYDCPPCGVLEVYGLTDAGVYQGRRPTADDAGPLLVASRVGIKKGEVGEATDAVAAHVAYTGTLTQGDSYGAEQDKWLLKPGGKGWRAACDDNASGTDVGRFVREYIPDPGEEPYELTLANREVSPAGDTITMTDRIVGDQRYGIVIKAWDGGTPQPHTGRILGIAADPSQMGMVTTGDQKWAGRKQFNDEVSAIQVRSDEFRIVVGGYSYDNSAGNPYFTVTPSQMYFGRHADGRYTFDIAQFGNINLNGRVVVDTQENSDYWSGYDSSPPAIGTPPAQTPLTLSGGRGLNINPRPAGNGDGNGVNPRGLAIYGTNDDAAYVEAGDGLYVRFTGGASASDGDPFDGGVTIGDTLNTPSMRAMGYTTVDGDGDEHVGGDMANGDGSPKFRKGIYINGDVGSSGASGSFGDAS